MSKFNKKNHRALHNLLPSPIKEEIACFVIYDHHPRDRRNLDITVCSKRGEILEYYQRELISKLLIENIGIVEKIIILRNRKCELFYLLVAENELFIISRKEQLQVHYRVSNVEKFQIEDLECSGVAHLKVTLKDEAMPLVFNENFDSLQEKELNVGKIKSEDLIPVVSQLKRKLTEAKYTKVCNENTYREYVKLRQAVAFCIYQKTSCNLEDSKFKLSFKKIANLLQVDTKTPIIKLCNKKIVIIIGLLNKNNEPIKDVCILLHTTGKCVVHTTKLYRRIHESPFWILTESCIDGDSESTITAVVNLEDVQFDVMSRIEFDLVVSYTKQGKNHLLPIESISISPLDVMGENFDILSGDDCEPNLLMLAILCTSEKLDLCLRHIKTNRSDMVTATDIFHTNLKMAMVHPNVAIHKISPFHILHGVMVVFEDNIKDSNSVINIEVYTRCPSQALALVHHIYSTVPWRIIVTTPDYKISALTEDLSSYSEESETSNKDIGYMECASSILKQTQLISEYFNECLLKMSEDTSELILSKIDYEINLMALGLPKYLEFRNKLSEEILKGINSIKIRDIDSDCMIID